MSDIKLSENYLIVGLGNPGREYQWTRHNLGFLVLEKLSETFGSKFKKSSLTNGVEALVKSHDRHVYLFMPQTYMNLSGTAVQRVLEKREIDLKNLLVVCDDVSIPFGTKRLRSKGSSGGHNGLKSIIHHLKSDQFARLRLGVGQPGGNMADYVLDEFSRTEKKQLPQFIDEAKESCLIWLEGGINKAMEQTNRRKENGKE